MLLQNEKILHDEGNLTVWIFRSLVLSYSRILGTIAPRNTYLGIKISMNYAYIFLRCSLFEKNSDTLALRLYRKFYRGERHLNE